MNQVSCECGYSTRSESEDQIVSTVLEHGRRRRPRPRAVGHARRRPRLVRGRALSRPPGRPHAGGPLPLGAAAGGEVSHRGHRVLGQGLCGVAVRSAPRGLCVRSPVAGRPWSRPGTAGARPEAGSRFARPPQRVRRGRLPSPRSPCAGRQQGAPGLMTDCRWSEWRAPLGVASRRWVHLVLYRIPSPGGRLAAHHRRGDGESDGSFVASCRSSPVEGDGDHRQRPRRLCMRFVRRCRGDPTGAGESRAGGGGTERRRRPAGHPGR